MGWTGKIMMACKEEKITQDWRDTYGKERESFYNRYGWGIEASEVEGREGYDMKIELIERERDIQKQWEDARIREAKYNKKI